jgi:hypothetical protein
MKRRGILFWLAVCAAMYLVIYLLARAAEWIFV